MIELHLSSKKVFPQK
ncbi:hypothetical protein FWK35_00015621 [Aphis craccivora]|uniref:Uncharacterized protein n=1 Tax=Aphis craccivora TaxID=307492 RepID=A0A6G0Z0V9_APHCR|nr:hypothetical protein FWK35_00015621 [Aphis craccivora]